MNNRKARGPRNRLFSRTRHAVRAAVKAFAGSENELDYGPHISQHHTPEEAFEYWGKK